MLVQQPLTTNLKTCFERIYSGNVSKEASSSVPMTIPLPIAQEMANAYHKWVVASKPMALATTQLVPGNVSALATSLMLPNLEGWAVGFPLYWVGVTFAGPGFIPVNPMDPISLTAATAQIKSLIQLMMPPLPPQFNTIDEFVGRLSTILYTCTKMLMVITTTTSAPPIVGVAPMI